MTDDRILIVRRRFEDSVFTEFDNQAGYDADAWNAVMRTFLGHFNKTFELFGREVELVDYRSQHDVFGTREEMCAEAAVIAEEMHAFATFRDLLLFAECAAERKLVTFLNAVGSDELLDQLHPYAWSLIQDCDRIAVQLAEYAGKRLVGRPAAYAGSAEYRTRTRKLGLYAPDLDVYKPCIEKFQGILERDHGARAYAITYPADASRLADTAYRAVLRFKEEGVTSLLLTCDPVSAVFLTQAATTLEWHPEWIIALGYKESWAGYARLYDPSQVNGHMFGRSGLTLERSYWGPGSEPARLYQKLTGRPLPVGAGAGAYYELLHMFSLLQAAGPHLTPETLALGAPTLPRVSGPGLGTVSYRQGPDGKRGAGDHTWSDTNREIYWDAAALGPDGKQGEFRAALGGRWFANGKWPRGQPSFGAGQQ